MAKLAAINFAPKYFFHTWPFSGKILKPVIAQHRVHVMKTKFTAPKKWAAIPPFPKIFCVRFPTPHYRPSKNRAKMQVFFGRREKSSNFAENGKKIGNYDKNVSLGNYAQIRGKYGRHNFPVPCKKWGAEPVAFPKASEPPAQSGYSLT